MVLAGGVSGGRGGRGGEGRGGRGREGKGGIVSDRLTFNARSAGGDAASEGGAEAVVGG